MKPRGLTVGTLAATALSISLGQVAFAADLPANAAPVAYYKAPVAHAYNWTGFYIGGHFGGAWGDKKWFEDATGSGTGVGPVGLLDGSYKVSGVLGGGQLGANYQTGWAVLGIEADISGAGINGSTASGACFATIGGNQSCSTKINWLSTVTGRLGAAFDRTLVYAKGGFAWAHEKHENPFNFGGAANDTDVGNETRGGWTIGGGVEYAWAASWSVKLEYDYMGFGTRNVSFHDPAGGGYTEDIRQNLHVIKVGINYRFGGPVH